MIPGRSDRSKIEKFLEKFRAIQKDQDSAFYLCEQFNDMAFHQRRQLRKLCGGIINNVLDGDQ